MAISNRQLIANRNNARKSTEPKSPRRRSAPTRPTPGLLLREVVIKHGPNPERAAALTALLADLCRELQPEGTVEQLLVERIATTYWRLRRALRYEMGVIRDRLDECPPATHTRPPVRGDQPPPPQLAHLDRCRDRLQHARAELPYERRNLDALSAPPELTDPPTLERFRPALEELVATHDPPPE